MSTIKEIIRNLRKNQTVAEDIVWKSVRRNLLGFKVKRQYPIKYKEKNKMKIFVADFYVPSKKLVVEIDGLIHEKKYEYDTFRSEIIGKLGFSILRFSNEQVDGEGLGERHE